jgi:hypothetical protein
MQRVLFVVPALVLAGAAAAQAGGRANPLDPAAKVPPAEYRSAFEGYGRFADQGLASWRRANNEVRAAGGHAGHKPGQGPGKETSKPQPGKAEGSGGDHGGHK